MAYGDAEETVREYKEKLIQSKSPGAYEDAIIIAKQQGAKTNKETEEQAKIILHSRIVDAEKNLARAKMHTSNVELLKGTQLNHTVTSVNRKTGKAN